MMVSQPVSSVARLLTFMAVLLALTVACKPWTTRPIERRLPDGATIPGSFDATAFVESVWPTRVLEETAQSAVALDPATLARMRPARAPAFVRGTGVVLRVDTRSRVGLALVDLAPGDGRADVAVQVGPVLRGTVLRDALPFVRFGDFPNQLAFADVANALNARVLKSVLAGMTPASLDGCRLTFRGAAKLDGTDDGRLPEIVPVVLSCGERSSRR
jgi:predicted lipoprotein